MLAIESISMAELMSLIFSGLINQSVAKNRLKQAIAIHSVINEPSTNPRIPKLILTHVDPELIKFSKLWISYDDRIIGELLAATNRVLAKIKSAPTNEILAPRSDTRLSKISLSSCNLNHI
jgi:hypothetical protein